MAISLVSKMFGGGLQVDKTPPPPPPSNVYLPQAGGQFPMYPPLFMVIGIALLEWVNKMGKKAIVVRKKQPIQRNSSHWKHFVNKPLSNFDLEKWIDDLKIKHFRSIFSRDRLPDQIRKKECGIINLDSIEGEGTHSVCCRNLDENMTEYFDPFGLIMPHEIRHYFLTPGKKVVILKMKYKTEILFFAVIGVCTI